MPKKNPMLNSFSLTETPKKIRLTLSNKSNDTPLPLAEIRSFMNGATKGWPKIAAGALCYRKKDPTTGRRKPVYIKDVADLFAWIDRFYQVNWSGASNCSTKTEYMRHLEQNCKQYTWATDLPHSPPLPDVLYTNPPPEPENTGRIEELVAMFDLHTPMDRVLVKAFILTPFWGGPNGKRPLFVFATPDTSDDPEAGRGAGKSTVAQIVGRLSGGYFSLRKEADVDRALSDLVSPSGLSARLVLMDNLKALKFSSMFLESLITTDQVDGHRLYHGLASRPNCITYVLTANEPMLSKDFATRCIPIILNQAKKDPNWDIKVEDLLKDKTFLKELYADILWHLQLPIKNLPTGKNPDGKTAEYDRWSLWWREVASRVCASSAELATLLLTVKKRRGQIDVDLAEREEVEDILTSAMITSGITDPEGVAVFFPTRVLGRLLGKMFDRDASASAIGRRLKIMQLPRLHYTEAGPHGKQRGYWWVGPESGINVAQGIGLYFIEDMAKPGGYKYMTYSNIETMKKLLPFCKPAATGTGPTMEAK